MPVTFARNAATNGDLQPPPREQQSQLREIKGPIRQMEAGRLLRVNSDTRRRKNWGITGSSSQARLIGRKVSSCSGGGSHSSSNNSSGSSCRKSND